MPVWKNRRPTLGVAPVIILLMAILSAACASSRAPVRPVQSADGLSVDDAAVRQWHFLFTRVSGVEWMTCLYGDAGKQGVRVVRSELADIASSGYAQVAGVCRPGSTDRLIGLAHSHPPRIDGTPSCLPSDVDSRSLGSLWQIVLVVCDTSDGTVTVGYRMPDRPAVVTSLAVPAVQPPVALERGSF